MIKRKQIHEKYNGRCAYCGTEITIKEMQIDHIHPKRSGGTDDFLNLNPSCKYCNNYKSGCFLETFRSFVKQMLNEKHEYLFKSKTKMEIGIRMGAVTMKKMGWQILF